ncbi:MAG: hypothetical protein ACM3WV_09715 [Bacillota bacterium]
MGEGGLSLRGHFKEGDFVMVAVFKQEWKIVPKMEIALPQISCAQMDRRLKRNESGSAQEIIWDNKAWKAV